MTVGKIDLFYLFELKHVFLRTENGKMEILQLCMNLGLIADHFKCPKCKNDMVLTKKNTIDGYVWECRTRKNGGHRVTRAVRMGSWFESSHLSMIDILLMTEFFVRKRSNEDVIFELNFAPQTVTDWRMFFREVCVETCMNKSEKIGGVGVTVEIHQSKVGKRKYRRKHVAGKWVFGGVESESNKCFLVIVKSRDNATLLSIIKDWIKPGTTIISDCWNSYDCLEDDGFIQYKSKHSLTFKDPETGENANSKEGTWNAAKRELPARIVTDSLDTYLAEYIWFRYHRGTFDRMRAFLEDIIILYNPFSENTSTAELESQ